MSYPKKIVGSTIAEEHLSKRPNFRYKKLIILMGANATGKTALGRILMGIFNFIQKKEYGSIVERIEDKTRTAGFEIDFVADDINLYRLSVEISPASNNGNYVSNDIHACVQSSKILSRDSYELCSSRFNDPIYDFKSNYIVELEKLPSLTWLFEYPTESEGTQHVIKPVDSSLFCSYLKAVLHALDPRIKNVLPVKDSDNTYIIIHPNMPIVMSNGVLNNPQKLSSGTLEGIGIAHVLASMKIHACSFYYCDEKFSHIHSEVEKAFLSSMVELIGPDEQLFFTTHNTDTLEMDFPAHSFAFMRRDSFDASLISCVFASEYIQKNDVSLKSAVENDIFSASPDVSEIFDILKL